MAYDLSYLRNRVLDDKLDDDSIDPNIIDRFLNDTQRSIFNTYELPYMEKIFQGTLPIDNYAFSFPTDYSILQSLIITGPDGQQRGLTDSYLPFRQFNDLYPTPGNNNPGRPSVWTTYASKFFVNCPTDQEYTLSMAYLKNPSEMSDDADVPDLPQSFEEVLVLGAYIRALERNEDFDLAAAVQRDYDKAILALTTRSTKRQSGTPVRIGQPNRAGVALRRRR